MRPEQVSTFVATRLKALRESRGYSLRQLAHRSDVTPEMLSRAERSERVPSIETLARVCAGLQITLSDFFDDSGTHLPQAKDTGPDLSSLEPRAREHFQDAIRSIQRGMEAVALPTGGRQRRRARQVRPSPR